MIQPIIRIVIRYGAGFFVGLETASMLANDPDVISVATAGVTAVIGLVNELWYRHALRNNGPT